MAKRKVPLQWSSKTDASAQEHNKQVLKYVRHLLRADETTQLVAQLKKWSPTDLLQLLTGLPLPEARQLFSLLPIRPSTKILAELYPDFRAELLKDETTSRLVEILNSLKESDLADTLDEFPKSLLDIIVPQLDARTEFEQRIRHGEDTAGRVMSRKFVAFREDYTAKKAISAIKSQYNLVGRFRTVFVVDAKHRLVGRLDVTRLLTLEPSARIGDVMDANVLAVSAEMDQEEVLRKAAKRQISSMPVIDARGKLIGRITTEQMDQIAREELSEDLMLMGGVSPEARPSDSVRRIIKGRLPWLITGLIGSAVAALVVGSFEEELQKAAILAAFIPVIMSIAGNSGLQASAVAVQGIATGSIWTVSTLFRLWKEFCGALSNGIIAGSVLTILISIGALVFEIHAPAWLALTAALSLTIVTTIAAMVGATVPVVLDRLGIDPAAATGVFITTSNDVLGVFVYFTIASFLYL
ncbi:Magnesium transporter MgtE [Pseudovibrio axinellae]|uniref:Magnesium transporter MgtE n=1 Tax=Pseudovibrio axinellae TaxID=989403 RepID=A0A166AD97_9HYPH|nr:magnesium transporter [Pseudovibrio axinellae]KZL20916.1 Magnesium transporter MgtE [Pseudovibrio axinellae]SEQ65940.1 magnesium transporter [Pseudovibrio axinellae]